jgi:hypothetical protein
VTVIANVEKREFLKILERKIMRDAGITLLKHESMSFS